MTWQPTLYKAGDVIHEKYFVLERQRGGHSFVYLCFDIVDLHLWALKTIVDERWTDATAQSDFTKRFLREVQTWINLPKHPNLALCRRAEVMDGLPYALSDWIISTTRIDSVVEAAANIIFSSKLLIERSATRTKQLRVEWLTNQKNDILALYTRCRQDERRLADWLGSGEMSMQWAFEIALDVTRGLIAARQAQPGLVHSDIKLDNILINRNRRALLSDFGIAKLATEVDGIPNAPPSDASAIARALILCLEHSADRSAQQRFSLISGVDVHDLLKVSTPELLMDQLDALYRSRFGCVPPPAPIEPLDGFELNSQGNAFANLGLMNDALQRYQQAVDLDPTNDVPAYGLALGFIRAQRYDAALQQLKHARRNISILSGAQGVERLILESMAQCCLNLGKHDDALYYIDQARDLDPNSGHVYLIRGLVHAGLKQFSYALLDFKKACEMQPLHIHRLYLGVAYAEMKEYASAISTLRTLLEMLARQLDGAPEELIGRDELEVIQSSARRVLTMIDEEC